MILVKFQSFTNLQRWLLDLDVGEDVVAEGEFPGPVGVGDAGVPHAGVKDKLVGALVRASNEGSRRFESAY